MKISKANRHQKIIALLHENGDGISVARLAEYFNASDVTIRKDLRLMEGKGMVSRRRGEVMLRENPIASAFPHRREIHAAEKAAIARRAAQLVQDGDAIILDTGSSTYALAEQLIAERKNKIIVVTNSIPIASLLGHKGINVEVSGGSLFGKQMALLGPYCEDFFEEIGVGRAFVCAAGVRGNAGFTISSSIEIAAKRKMMGAAAEVVVLCDSSKFQIFSVNLFAKFSEVNRIITDYVPELEPQYKKLREHAIEIDFVNV